MTFTPVIAEQTTAATDLALGMMALVLFARLRKLPAVDLLKRRYWSWMFGFLGIASFLGTIVHGLELPVQLHKAIWHILYLSLGMTVAFFAIGAMHELLGGKISRRLMPWILATALLFYLITVIIPGSFLVFTVYEAIALSGALGIYLYLSFRKQYLSYYIMVIGIAISILAAVVQALGKAHLTLVWEFNHNGIFHLIQLTGAIFVYLSLAISLRTHDSDY